jgi:hypothetical protein
MRLKDLVGTVGEPLDLRWSIKDQSILPCLTVEEFSRLHHDGIKARLSRHPVDCLGCSYCRDEG